MDVAVRSDAGAEQARNHDAYLWENVAGNASLVAVADGFGTIGNDESVGALALGFIRDFLRRKLRNAVSTTRLATVSEIRTLLQSAFSHANARLYTQSGSHEDYVASGTTLTCALIVGHQAFVGHVGDSRAYLLRGVKLQLLTSDDALLADVVPIMKTMLKAQARVRSLLTRSLGTQSTLDASVIHFELLAGDQLVLCTDGIHRYVEEEEMGRALLSEAALARAAEAIVLTAKARGSGDNATVVVGRDLSVHVMPEALVPPRDDAWRSRKFLIVFVVLWTAVLVAGMLHVFPGVH